MGARASAPRREPGCTAPGAPSVLRPAGFSEIKEIISRFCSNALEIHKLRNIGPNLMKNIACGFCDTFLWGFI